MASAYKDEDVVYIVKAYKENPTDETVDTLAAALGKSRKSIIGKLSREGVYVKKSYRNKRGEPPITKVELVQQICDRLGVPNLEGLEKAPKNVLLKLVKTIPAP